MTIPRPNDFVTTTKQMMDDYNMLCKEVDLVLHHFRIDNTELAEHVGLNRISIGRKRANKIWKPEELEKIANYLTAKFNL